MSSVLALLLSELDTRGADLAAEELCDALWLMAAGLVAGSQTPPQLDEIANGEPPQTGERPSSLAPTPHPQASLAATDQPAAARAGEGSRLPVYPLASQKPGGQAAVPITLGGAPAISNRLALDRALRPFRKRRVLSASTCDIDEDATVEQVVETGVLSVVRRPVRSRWLDLSLVVERSPTMRLWQDTGREFRDILARGCGARTMALHYLEYDAQGSRLTTPGGRLVPTAKFASAGCAQLIWFLSDALSFGWLTATIPELLLRWTRHRPVIHVQVLPPALWPRTSLRRASLQPSPKPRGGPWLELVAKGRASGLPVSVVHLDAAALRAHAEFFVGGRDGLVLDLGTESGRFAELASAPGTQRPRAPAELDRARIKQTFDRFWQFAAPSSRKLATYLASVPLFLPIMRLVQRVLVADSAPWQLAEIFMSGILCRADSDGSADPTPDQIEYAFLPGIRERLLDLGGLDREFEAIELLSEYAEQRFGKGNDFAALLANPESSGEGWQFPTLRKEEHPFARIAAFHAKWLNRKHAHHQVPLSVPIETTKTQPSSVENTDKRPVIPIDRIFTITGIPEFTFVQTVEYQQVKAVLQSGASIVIQGPSCSGKTTLVAKALRELNISARWLRCSDDADMLQLARFFDRQIEGNVVIDGAHLLRDEEFGRLGAWINFQQIDLSPPRTQIIVIGTGRILSTLLAQVSPTMRDPLARRLSAVDLRFDAATGAELAKLIELGEQAANIRFDNASHLIDAASGSFYTLQLLCSSAAKEEGLFTSQPVLQRVRAGFNEILPNLIPALGSEFSERLTRLASTDSVKPPRGAMALLLWMLGQSGNGQVGVWRALDEYPRLSAAFKWLLQGSLAAAIKSSRLSELLEFHPGNDVLMGQDPRLLLYLRFMDWSDFLRRTGNNDLYMGTDGLMHHRSPVVTTTTTTVTTTNRSIRELFVPPLLAEAVHRRRVIPLAGMGVSRAVKNMDTGKPLFPDWKELLRGAAELLKRSGKQRDANVISRLASSSDSESLLDATRQAQKGLGPVWLKYLRDVFDPPADKAQPKSLALARSLWQLGSRLVVTTNYDHVLRWACPKSLRDELRTWDISAPSELATMLRDGLDYATIWHLFGHADNLAGVILTPDGYQRLYPARSAAKRSYEASLDSLHAVLKSRTLLFVGWSFTDENITGQVSFIEELCARATGPHYMMVDQPMIELTRGHIRGMSSIELISYDGSDALPDLLRRLGAPPA